MSRHAFSLVELMVSLALAMVLVAMAWSAYVRTSEATRRVSARVELHESAATMRGFLHGDVANMAPALALFARSRPQVPSGGDRIDTVELVFMRAPVSLVDQSVSDGNEQFKEDFHWVRWRFIRVWREIGAQWQVVDAGLHRSTSSPTRRWSTLASWATPGTLDDPAGGKPSWTNYGGRSWINIPRPLRSAAHGIESLDFNRYGIPANRIDPSSTMPDIGDLADLELNERLLSSRVRDFALALVDARGQSVTVTSGTAADIRIDGVYMDGLGPVGNPYLVQLAGRPKVVRCSFTMYERTTGVDQTFSFSAATPGMQPQIGQ